MKGCRKDTWRLPDEYPHASCGGFCVKGGHAHFKRLYEEMPERHAYHEAKEEELRAFRREEVSILKNRRGGKTVPLPLAAFREGLESGPSCNPLDAGGYGCIIEPEGG